MTRFSFQQKSRKKMEIVSSSSQQVSQQNHKSDKLKSSKSRQSKAKNRKSKKGKAACEVKNAESKSKWKLFLSLDKGTPSCCYDDQSNDVKLSSLIVAWCRERLFHLLGVLSLLICAILFTLQAYLTFRSYQIMHQMNVKKHVPEMLYQFYFDSHDWSINLDKVDLRANTSIYIH